MALTIDKVVDGLGTNSSPLVLDKASITGQLAGTFTSLWRATGQPAQGAIPGAAAVCDELTTGCFQIPQQTAPIKTYLTYMEGANTNAGMTLELHDRLMHMGGLNGTLTTSQTVNVDLEANLGVSNLADRIGDSDYSDVQWWLEWYAATGATNVQPTINVTYSDGTSGNLTLFSLGVSRPASHMINLNVFRPAAVTAFIRDVNTLQLSATTGTAGSFGITATRKRGSLYMPIANAMFNANWADIPLCEIRQESCLFPMMLNSTTSSGAMRGVCKVSHMDPS
jgi:hypothetical protein